MDNHTLIFNNDDSEGNCIVNTFTFIKKIMEKYEIDEISSLFQI